MGDHLHAPRLSPRLASTCACVGAMFIAGWVYYPVLSAGFANYDDQQYAILTARVRAAESSTFSSPVPGWQDAIVRAFSAGRIQRPAGVAGIYQPLVELSFVLDGYIAGDPQSLAFQLHFTNLLIHLVNVALVFVLVLKLATNVGRGRARTWAFLLSLLFALHPVQVESVAWVSQRMTLLGEMFTLLALICYLRHAQAADGTNHGPPLAGPRARKQPVVGLIIRQMLRCRWLLPVGLFYAAALLCRPLFIALPLVLFLLDAWPLRRFLRSTSSTRHVGAGPAIEKLPLLAIFCVGLGFQYAVHARVFSSSIAPAADLQTASEIQGIGLFTHAFVSLAARLFWPIHLAPYQPRSTTVGGTGFGVAFDVAFLLLGGAALAWSFRRHRAIFTALAGGAVVLLPALWQAPYSPRLLSDQYLYGVLILPIVAFAGWLGGGFGSGSKRLLTAGTHRAGLITAGAFVVLFSFLSHSQSRVWHSGRELYAHTISIDPEWPFGYVGLVEAHIQADDLDAAMQAAEKAADIAPDDPATQFYLGTVLLLCDDERSRKAIPLLASALKADPDWIQCLQNLGVALARNGRSEEAIAYFERARDLEPDSTGIRIGLGNAYLKVHRFASARGEFQEALRQRNDSAANLGLAIAWAGNDVPEYARRHLAAAVAKDPTIAARAARSEQLRRLHDFPGFDSLLDLSDHSNGTDGATITESPPARRAHGS